MDIFIVSATVFLLLVSLLELKFPKVRLPKIPGWWTRVILLQLGVIVVIQLGVNSWSGYIITLRIFSLEDKISAPVMGFLSYFIGSFIFYWWHRARHEVPWMWRHFHQIHHSPARVQAVTAFYVHPLEAVASSLLNAFIIYILCGHGIEAASWNGLLMALAGTFYHMNLSTPHWVGYFVQRPEMHKLHHKRGFHSLNYSDLPIWDILFGTFINPRYAEEICGFETHQELAVIDLLMGRDVTKQQFQTKEAALEKQPGG